MIEVDGGAWYLACWCYIAWISCGSNWNTFSRSESIIYPAILSISPVVLGLKLLNFKTMGNITCTWVSVIAMRIVRITFFTKHQPICAIVNELPGCGAQIQTPRVACLPCICEVGVTQSVFRRNSKCIFWLLLSRCEKPAINRTSLNGGWRWRWV